MLPAPGEERTASVGAREFYFVRDPDSMEQDSTLPGGHHFGSPSRKTNAAGIQTETPSSQG
jgi:hypothetical protein